MLKSIYSNNNFLLYHFTDYEFLLGETGKKKSIWISFKSCRKYDHWSLYLSSLIKESFIFIEQKLSQLSTDDQNEKNKCPMLTNASRIWWLYPRLRELHGRGGRRSGCLLQYFMTSKHTESIHPLYVNNIVA